MTDSCSSSISLPDCSGLDLGTRNTVLLDAAVALEINKAFYLDDYSRPPHGLILGRVVLSNDGLEPLPETFPLILALGKLVGGGELYEAYEALFDGRPVVAKLSDLTQFPTSLYSDHTEESALAALVMEEAIYTTTLRSFAGCVVPRDYGLFATGTIYCRIEENVGRMLTEEEKLHPEVIERLIDVYTELHAAGVFHNDVDWRHVTVSDGPLDPATLRLVDFNNSFVRPPDRDGWNLCRDMELGSVLSLRERVACMKERCEALGYPLVTSKEAAALAIVKESVTLRRAAVRKERRAAERKEARDNTKRQWQRAIVRLVMPWRR